mmetsp:Transcript_13387/g.34730  ORF Transcript_13387/g.34730 Transcript_13387/m.34730 type:complete len:126 (+) Transcript_13387:3-380(+)
MHQAKHEGDLSRDIGGSLYRSNQAKQNRKLSHRVGHPAVGFVHRTVRRFHTGVTFPSPKTRLASKVYRRQRGLMVDRKQGTPSTGSSEDSTSGVEVDTLSGSPLHSLNASMFQELSGLMLETVDE